jgi:hypothetical protein
MKNVEIDSRLKDVSKQELERSLRKSQSVTIRVTENDKKSMEETAQKLGLTLTDYLIRLHFFAADRFS